MTKGWRYYMDKTLEAALVVLTVLLLADVLLQVASRYLLNNSISFTDELAGFLLIWVGMLGATYVTSKREHLAINLLADRLSATQHRWLHITSNLCILLFVVLVMVVGGSWLVYTRFYLGQLSASLEVPLGVVYLIIPISGVLSCLYVLGDIFSPKHPTT